MAKKIKKISNFVKFPELEDEVTNFWKKNEIFKKSLEIRQDSPKYTFMDGPPFVTGIPHFGSLLPSIAKDIIPRYQTMKGKYVRRVFGWDCHGLPIEEKISEKLELKTRDDIKEYGVDKYIKECRDYVNSVSSQWEWYIDKIGRWVDLENAYYTMKPEFNESVIWFYKQAHEKGLIYKGKRVSLYSTDNQTPVSEFEVNMDPSNYKDVKDIAIYVNFPILDDGERFESSLVGASLMIWTTTPWTIAGHTVMAFNKSIEYVLVEFEGNRYVLAKSRLESVFSTDESHIGSGPNFLVNIIEELDSSKLAGIKYEPVYDYHEKTDKHYTLYHADYVTDTDGTGLVHIAPYGKEDYDLLTEHGIQKDLFFSITEDGRMLHGRQAGKHMRDMLGDITREIDEKGKLFSSASYTHRLPFYRGKNPLIYMPQDSYFIDIQKIKPRMIELNQDINWYPSHLKNGRFHDVIEKAPDWCISRTRFWATIMPLWKAENGDEIVIGGIEEMSQYNSDIKKNDEGRWYYKDQELFLHRDVCDQIVLTKDGVEYHRVEEVLDNWMDSGAVPFAEFSYPFNNQEEFMQSMPADYIIEYVGQLRAWFNALLRMSVIAFDNIPFKNSVVTGNIGGNDGRKMSKSFKNYPDPKDLLENIGGEAFRMYMMGSSVMNGEDIYWSDEVLNDQVKNVMIPFWNTFTYFTIYAEIHDYTPTHTNFVGENILDKWLQSRVDLAVKDISTAWDNYDMPSAVKEIRPIVDDISQWYIRRSRDRFASGDTDAIQNLYAGVIKLSKAIAPQMSFITEKIYQEIVVGVLDEAKESIHLEDYPTYGEIDTDLIAEMQKLRSLCSLGLSIRADHKLSVRQPVSKVYTDLKDEKLRTVLQKELNAKSVELIDDKSKLSSETIIVNEDEKIGFVAIETHLDDELINEGLLADLNRKIQNARKNSGLQMGQEANILIDTENQEVSEFINSNIDLIKSATSLSGIEFGNVGEKAKNKFKFKGETVYFDFK